MHELAIMENVVDAITEQLGHQRVTLVRLEIGELASVDLETLKFCFEVCTRGTSLENAELAVLSIAARARCHSCGEERPLPSLVAPCACGSFDRELTAGDELRIKDVEVS